MRLFITAILIVCFSAISAAAKGGIETTVYKLKCISANSNALHSGELTITINENFDLYINDINRLAGEMVYNGELISDGKLKQITWSAKIIQHGFQLVGVADQNNHSLFFDYYIVHESTGDVYRHSVSLRLEEGKIYSTKLMNCAYKE